MAQKTFIDGVDSVENIGSTIRIHTITFRTGGSGNVEAEEAVELVIAMQDFPKLVSTFVQAMNKFVEQKLYSQQKPEQKGAKA